MRHKTLFSLIALCGSSAALATMAPPQTDPLANNATNEAAPVPGDTTAPETWSNSTDVEPSAEPAPDPTENGSDTAPEPDPGAA